MTPDEQLEILRPFCDFTVADIDCSRPMTEKEMAESSPSVLVSSGARVGGTTRDPGMVQGADRFSINVNRDEMMRLVELKEQIERDV